LVGKPTFTSALQIRFAGCKGVLCVDPNLRASQMCIRPSMKKFESPHRRLELLQTSRPQAVYLNQQTIMLLSNLGVPDEIFLNLQQKMLDNLAGTLAVLGT
jgi:RNA-dependent RNA polymerase